MTKKVVNSPSPNYARTFDLPLGLVTGEKGFGFRYGDMIVRGDGYITFYKDYISMSGPAPRLYVYNTNRQKKWKNIEIEVEYMRVAESSTLSYAGLGIGARSIHETQTNTNLVVPTYYLKHTFDSKLFFEKEDKHGVSYVKQPNSQDTSYPNPKNIWQRVKFTVIDNELKGFKWDKTLSEWTLVKQFTDTGSWNCREKWLYLEFTYFANKNCKELH